MSKSFATLIDEVQSGLWDDATIFTDAFTTIQLEQELKEISDYVPYIRKEVYRIESRTGTANADTASALVDTTEDQFLSTDAWSSGNVGMMKVIHNTTNDTWAIVRAYVDETQLTLSWDAFPDGDEDYEMFNEGCWNKYQVNIEDVTDYIGKDHGVIAVEYPMGTRRNFTVEGDILTVKVDSVSDSKVAEPATDTEVHIWFQTRQRVSQLTDFLGKINNGAGYAINLRSIVVDDFGASEVIAEDTLFTIGGYSDSIRGKYRVTDSVTMSSGGGTVLFHPGLASAVADDDVVTVIGSTLDSRLERLLVDLTIARIALNRSAYHINIQNIGSGRAFEEYQTLGNNKLALVLSELNNLKQRRTKRTYSRE